LSNFDFVSNWLFFIDEELFLKRIILSGFKGTKPKPDNIWFLSNVLFVKLARLQVLSFQSYSKLFLFYVFSKWQRRALVHKLSYKSKKFFFLKLNKKPSLIFFWVQMVRFSTHFQHRLPDCSILKMTL
jgi:hypothetical protein